MAADKSSLLPAVSKLNRNENHLMLLAVIAKMDDEDINTDIERLSDLGKFFKSHVEYMLENLIEEGLVKIEHDDEHKSSRGHDDVSNRGAKSPSTSERDTYPPTESTESTSSHAVLTIRLPKAKRLVEVHDFTVTQKGRTLLEEKKKELSTLSVAMQRLYNKKNVDELYRAIFWNREWIAFMLYTGVLTIEYLETMMKLLGLDMYRLSMTEAQETADGLGIDAELLSMGLFLAHPLMAIASYIVSMVTMRKLEEKWKPQKVKKAKEAEGKLDGEIYIPKAD